MLDQVRHGVHYEARQSECKWGHPLSGLNARPHRRKNGRICRACAAARAKAQRDAHEGLPAENHKDLADAYYRRFTKEWHEAVLIAHRDTTVALHTIHGWQRFQWGWPRFLLVWAASFQAIAAGVLAFAPYEQVLTQGTRPVLEMASRYVWAALFFASAAATGAAPWMRPGYRALAWVAVMGLGGVWLTAFAVNVANGGGSALGLVSWFFLYVPIVAVALHMGLAKR